MKKSVLCIEDDQNIQMTLRHLLEAENYKVFVANHGKEGLALLRKMTPPCVVLLDIQMPEMDGYEFMLKKNADPLIATIPVVILSADGDVKRLVGVADFIRKPFEISRLLRAVERYCGIGG